MFAYDPGPPVWVCFDRIVITGMLTEIAHGFKVEKWERRFNDLAKRFCPIQDTFKDGYRWTAMQIESAMDVVFKDGATLGPLYEK